MSVTGHIIGNWNLTGEVNETGEGANVVPNPPEEATDTLEKIGIDDVVYSITGEQEQADWDQADPTAVDYIKNKPTIPAAQVNSDWDAVSGVEEILNKPTLSAVATSGSYTDLTDTPTIPAAQVNSDWDAASGVAEILNKPSLSTVATSGDYDDLINKPTIPAAQVNSDWNAASGVAQILNKPTIPAAQVNSDWNANSGVAQILNKPTIPAAQVNSDWDAASGVAQILNKPTLAAVATSGESEDVSYDNSVSGMTATDVQAAVDELKSNLTHKDGTITARSQYNITASEVKVMEQLNLVYVKFYATRTSALGTSQITVADLSGVTLPKETVRFTCSSGAYAYACKNSCYGVIGTDGTISVSCNNASDTVVVINMVYSTI